MGSVGSVAMQITSKTVIAINKTAKMLAIIIVGIKSC